MRVRILIGLAILATIAGVAIPWKLASTSRRAVDSATQPIPAVKPAAQAERILGAANIGVAPDRSPVTQPEVETGPTDQVPAAKEAAVTQEDKPVVPSMAPSARPLLQSASRRINAAFKRAVGAVVTDSDKPTVEPVALAEQPANAEQVVRNTIHLSLSALESCYQNSLRRDSRIKGRIEVSVSVSAEGLVNSAKLVETTIQDEGVLSCITSRLRQLRFGRLGEEVEVTLPLSLVPHEG